MQSTKLKSRSGQVPQHWRGVLPVHDACDLLPPMSESELRELGEDIKRHNLHTPVVVFTDKTAPSGYLMAAIVSTRWKWSELRSSTTAN